MSSLDQHVRRMLDEQLAARGIADRRVLAAMAKVPRHAFLPGLPPEEAYADRAWGIECGQTISQPYIVALMTEALGLEGNERVLEVGTGSGYQTAVLAELAREVVTIERHAELAAGAADRLADLGYTNARCLVGDGTLGWPELAPYEGILVAAAADAPPPALLEQLAEGGVLVMPVGSSESQVLKAIRRQGDRIEEAGLAPCRFVPLIGRQGRAEG